MSQDTEQSQQSPREIAEKLHRKIKRLIDADRQHYEPSGLYEIVTWIAAAIKAERESVAAKDRQIAAERQKFAWIGDVTPCPNCDGSGKNAHGDCCRIPGHARGCLCAICHWKNAYYRQEGQIAALQKENASQKQMVEYLREGAEHQRKTSAEEYLAVRQQAIKFQQQRDALAEALKELIRQVDISNAVDDHGHHLKHLKALADGRAALASVDEQKQQEPKNASDPNVL